MRSNRFAVIGNNISYTKSPDVFNAIFQLNNVDASFEVHDIEPDHLQASLRQLMLDGVSGFCVTIPFKEAVMPFLDDIGSVAQAVGAVNSIAAADGQLLGYNTDCYGFAAPLVDHAESLNNGSAIILGSGGAARAVAHSLISRFDIGSITVCGRTETRLQEFKAKFGSNDKVTVKTAAWDKVDKSLLFGAAIIVNCTPVAGSNNGAKLPFSDHFDSMPDGAVYYDLNYNCDNGALQIARDAGLFTIDGSKMLVAQALRSWDIWTGNKLDFDSVYKAAFRAA